MLVATISRHDLLTGNYEKVEEISYPSPNDVPVIPAIAMILIDWLCSDECPNDLKRELEQSSLDGRDERE